MQVDLQLRKVFLELRPERQEQPGGEEAVHADGEAPGLALVRGARGGGEEVEGLAGGPGQGLARRCQLQALGAAHEQHRCQAPLELAHLAADGAGGHAKLAGCLGHRAVPRRSFEGSNGVERGQSAGES